MTSFVLSGPTLLPDGRITSATLRLAAGRIARISPGLDAGADLRVTGLITPGLIDLQLNGGWGNDFSSDGGGVAAVAARLPATGVTAFLPTIVTSPFDTYPRRLAEIAAVGAVTGGATVLGIHLEGPYFSPLRAGAHDPACLRPIDVDEIERWAADPQIRLVTLAPELPDAGTAIGRLRARGIVVSAGHSDATYTQALAGFSAGITWGTHLFNAMRPLHQREPGLVGALLTGPVGFGLIADGVHVHPALVALATQLKAGRGLTLVTDAIAAMGMPPGCYRLGAREIIVDATTARLADGTLAGSIVTLDAAVRNLIAFTGCSPAVAFQAATAAPAAVLGLTTKGRLTAGADADLAIFDEHLRVVATISAGRLVYQAATPAEPVTRCDLAGSPDGGSTVG